MDSKAHKADLETLHQWEVIEEARSKSKTSKRELSLVANMQDSYYFQSHKFKRPIPLEVLSAWADELRIPIGLLFIEGDADPKAKIISLIQQADDEKLPQAVRILEALLTS